MKLPTCLIALAAAALMSANALAAPIRIVAFGDSLTSGYLVPPEQAYPAQLQEALRKKGHDVTVKNAGIGGDTTKGALKRFDLAVDPGTDICILEFGSNDLSNGVPKKTLHARMAELIRALTARRIEVLVVGVGAIDLAQVAADNGALYAQWKLPPRQHRARDGAHYNAEGYTIVVGQMLAQVEALIARLAPK